MAFGIVAFTSLSTLQNYTPKNQSRKRRLSADNLSATWLGHHHIRETHQVDNACFGPTICIQ